MRLVIEGAPEEIAALVLTVQGRREEHLSGIEFHEPLESLVAVLKESFPAIGGKGQGVQGKSSS